MEKLPHTSYPEPANLPGIEDGIREPVFDDPRVIAAEEREEALQRGEDLAKQHEYQPGSSEASTALSGLVAAYQRHCPH